MSPPSISVIVVVRNGAKYIAQALRSILKQTMLPNEIIVVDGKSTDGTVEIARNFKIESPSIRIFDQAVLGLAYARNLGLRMAQGELIAFLDHDDLWHPKKIEYQVHCLQNNPSAQYAICELKMFVEKGDQSREKFPQTYLSTNHLGKTPSALMAKKMLFSEIGLFDPSLRIGCDADWFARAHDSSIPFEVVFRPLVFKRIHLSNLSANVILNREELLNIARRSIDRKKAKMV